jgi:TonB family protein
MEQKPCIRCGRVIDALSKSCVYCNWDQGKPYIPEKEPVVQTVAVRREERDWKRYALIGGGVVLLLIGAFYLGALINRDGAPTVVPESKLDQPAPPPPTPIKQANTTLEPVSGNNMNLEEPITTAPSATPGAPDALARTDATAVSAAEYAQLAARAQAEKRAGVVDPRSITGAAYSGGVPMSAPAPRQRTLAARRLQPAGGTAASAPPAISARTRPVPEYQPLPSIHTAGDATARLELTVGADGNVKEVTVVQGIPGETPRIIAAVQSWRFRPATENGHPVSAPFTVDISFNGRD